MQTSGKKRKSESGVGVRSSKRASKAQAHRLSEVNKRIEDEENVEQHEQSHWRHALRDSSARKWNVTFQMKGKPHQFKEGEKPTLSTELSIRLNAEQPDEKGWGRPIEVTLGPCLTRYPEIIGPGYIHKKEGGGDDKEAKKPEQATHSIDLHWSGVYPSRVRQESLEQIQSDAKTCIIQLHNALRVIVAKMIKVGLFGVFVQEARSQESEVWDAAGLDKKADAKKFERKIVERATNKVLEWRKYDMKNLEEKGLRMYFPAWSGEWGRTKRHVDELAMLRKRDPLELTELERLVLELGSKAKPNYYRQLPMYNMDGRLVDYHREDNSALPRNSLVELHVQIRASQNPFKPPMHKERVLLKVVPKWVRLLCGGDTTSVAPSEIKVRSYDFIMPEVKPSEDEADAKDPETDPHSDPLLPSTSASAAASYDKENDPNSSVLKPTDIGNQLTMDYETYRAGLD